MIRLFLDANVLFTAAHNRDGKAALVIDLAAEGIWEVVTSTFAAEEARFNLGRKYPEAIHDLEKTLAAMRIVKSGTGERCPVSLEEKDRPILEAAIHGGATHLLTGDMRHFGPYMNRAEETGGVTITTVADFLRTFRVT